MTAPRVSPIERSMASSPPPRKKSVARVIALQALYQYDVRGPSFVDEAEAFFRASERTPDDVAMARDLFLGCLDYLDTIDAALAKIARHWDLKRMAAVDRAILRLGAYELLHTPDVPPKVALTEAIRLAKKYSTDESGAFVNGLLDKLMPRGAPPAPAPQAS